MAESAVILVIDRLVPLLTNEANLLTGIHREIVDIKDELVSTQAFLRDADMKVEYDDANSGLKLWVKQVRELAFQIEDVIDEYVLHVARHPADQHGFLHKVKLTRRHHVASKTKNLKNFVQLAKEKSDRYSLSSLERARSSISWNDPRVACHFIEEAELVGVETPKNELVSKLVEGPSKNMVISLVGMGGLGKTTLAIKAFEHQRVSAHFSGFAWITVSHQYNRVQLLRAIIKEFRNSAKEPPLWGIDSMNEQSFIRQLREYLLEKRYVIVFDDIWDGDFWGCMKYALPDNDKGNRIIITACIENATPPPKESPFYCICKVQPLSKEKALELFCKKVFQYEEGHCPHELLELSIAIVEGCDGLSLAIVTMGGLLAAKEKNMLEWQKFYDSLGYELASNHCFSSITRISILSYQNLPFHFKNCFLYFGMFPEDELISCCKLIRLWMAEGFMRQRRGKTQEEVGEEYMRELIQRSLVQVSKPYIDGKAKKCRVHDLMYDIICSRLEELGLRRVSVDRHTILEGSGRHLSIHCKANNHISESSSTVKYHSVLLFCVNNLPNSLSTAIFTSCKLLKVLDFEGAPLYEIPEEFGSLLHLSYLSFKDMKVETLPRSTGKLKNLETLDLRECLLYNLTLEINCLLKLRYLVGHCFYNGLSDKINVARGLKIRGSIGCLNALQSLAILK